MSEDKKEMAVLVHPESAAKYIYQLWISEHVEKDTVVLIDMSNIDIKLREDQGPMFAKFLEPEIARLDYEMKVAAPDTTNKKGKRSAYSQRDEKFKK